MIEEEIPDETEDDEDAVGRGEQRQTRESLGEGADQIGRDVSRGEEEVDQEEEPRSVLDRENSRVRQQRVELLVKVGVLQIVSAMGKGEIIIRGWRRKPLGGDVNSDESGRKRFSFCPM